MKYVFDIDGTICDKNNNDDYDKSYPFLERIRKINKEITIHINNWLVKKLENNE